MTQQPASPSSRTYNTSLGSSPAQVLSQIDTSINGAKPHTFLTKNTPDDASPEDFPARPYMLSNNISAPRFEHQEELATALENVSPEEFPSRRHMPIENILVPSFDHQEEPGTIALSLRNTDDAKTNPSFTPYALGRHHGVSSKEHKTTSPDTGLGDEDAKARQLNGSSMNDLSKPHLEQKTFWDGEKGPVTREDFNEFKAMKDEELRALKVAMFDLARDRWDDKTSSHADKEEEKTRIQGESSSQRTQDRRLMEDTYFDNTNPLRGVDIKTDLQAEIEGTNDELAGLKVLLGLDKVAHRPYPKVYTLNPDGSHPECDEDDWEFLYDDWPRQVKEGKVEIWLLRALFQIRSPEPDYNEILNHALEALSDAILLDYEPLVARCKYYMGVADYGLKDYASAVQNFVKARACIGHYQEGQNVESWYVKATRAEVETPISAREARDNIWVRTRKEKRGIEPVRSQWPGYDDSSDEESARPLRSMAAELESLGQFAQDYDSEGEPCDSEDEANSEWDDSELWFDADDFQDRFFGNGDDTLGGSDEEVGSSEDSETLNLN